MSAIEVLTAILVVITGVYAYLTFRILQTNRDTVAVMKAQVESATRPYIIVELARARAGFYSFRISNVGRSAAVQVRLKSDPLLKPVRASGNVTQVGRIPDSLGFFDETITYLAPSQTLEALVGHYSGIRSSYPQLRFRISMDYQSTSGNSYSETVELSLKPTDEALHLVEYDIGQELHEVQQTLERIKSKLEA